jgi:hypothetical protein
MYVLGGTRTSSGKRAGPTIYELNASREGRSSRDIPRLAAAGVAICWHAGPSELITMAVLELVSGIGLAAEVVVGRRVLEAIAATQHTSAGMASMWPGAVLLGVITAALGLAGVVLREKERMLSELTSRYAQDRILDVTCAVDLAAFDQPEFHDRVARAQAGVFRSPQMVFGLQGLGRSMAGAIGAAVALLAVAPFLVPVALLAAGGDLRGAVHAAGIPVPVAAPSSVDGAGGLMCLPGWRRAPQRARRPYPPRRRTNHGSRSGNRWLLAILCQNPAVAKLDELKIPRAMRPVAEDIIEITDGVCAEPVEGE